MSGSLNQASILVMLKENPHDHVLFKARLDELEEVAKAVGYNVKDRIVQTRIKPDPKYFIGSGKVDEITELAEKEGISHLIFWNIISSRQKYDVEAATGMSVKDRSDLILELFSQNAHTTEAKLQIELAKMKKLFPYERYKAWVRLQRERPGFHSSGEYAYHSRVKQLQKTIKNTEGKLEDILRRKRNEIQNRKEIGKLVTITGFYNAGKTTLFNLLTEESKPVSNIPFTTLASKVSQAKGVLITDTIGFVQDMDDLKELITSFKPTLEDIRMADLVLCMIDISDDPIILERKLKEAIKILGELEVPPHRILILLNKIDLLNERDVKEHLEMVRKYGYNFRPISAHTKEGIEELSHTLEELGKVTEKVES
ncbi:MAG: GTPase HflX [Archaeoglobaceae archaeon]